MIRLPIDQHRRDVASGLNTRTFVTGYPGSPLGGYDISLRTAGAIVGESGITHVPAQAEELGVTVLMGTQMIDDHPRRDGIEGVVGIWYGKGPGIDRSGDALRHAKFAGTSRLGAVVVLGGEDPESKSSTLPFQEDYAFMSAGIPIVYPSSVAEFLEYGLHAIALSRYSGCWIAMKLIGQLCDGGETFEVSPDFPKIVIPDLTIDGEPFRKYTDFTFFPGLNIDPERRLYPSVTSPCARTRARITSIAFTCVRRAIASACSRRARASRICARRCSIWVSTTTHCARPE